MGENADARRALPAASLIICTRNRARLAAETVDSILRGDAVPAELVVVDQSEAPNPAIAALDGARGCAVRYVRTPTVGLSRARNLGIAAASHELLVFTDDDVLVAPTWYVAIVEALAAAGPRTVVTGQVRPAVAEVRGGFAPAIREGGTAAVYRGRLDQDVLYPLNMALYRSLIEEIGTFDERLGAGTRFPGAEDSDFSFRLLEAGYAIAYAPQAVLYHRAWRRDRDYLPHRWDYGRGRGAFYAKHASLHDRYILRRMWRDTVPRALWAPLRFRRDRRRALGDLALACGIVSGALHWLAGGGRAARSS